MAIIASKKQSLVKLLAVFIAYLGYTYVFSTIFNLFGINDSITISFVADLVFFLGIVILYKDSLRKDWNNFIHDFQLRRKLKIVLGGAIGIFLINILGGMITEVLFPGQDMTDENTDAIYALGNISLLYTIFKTTIFSVIAEELVFRKTVKDVIDNSILFVIISGLIYALMNIAYSDFNMISIIDLIQCFIFGAFISIVYVRNNNIVSVMFMKFVYTLVPLTIMLLGLGA